MEHPRLLPMKRGRRVEEELQVKDEPLSETEQRIAGIIILYTVEHCIIMIFQYMLISAPPHSG